MGLGSILNHLPSVGSLSLVWRVISFIFFLLLVIPPLYGLGVVFLTSKVPPFVPQDALTKLEFGFVYGYYSAFDATLRPLLGLTGGAQIAKDSILSGTITDVSLNASDYPAYENISKYWDCTFQNMTLQTMNEYYYQYAYSMGIDTNSSWGLNFFIVTRDGKYLLSDLYVMYTPEQSFSVSIQGVFDITPKYGVIVTEDVVNTIPQIMTGTTIDYGKMALLVLSTVRNGNIVLFTY